MDTRPARRRRRGQALIVGAFRDRLPLVLLTLEGRSGSLTVEFVLDTGFDGYVTLPQEVLRRLGATESGQQKSRLADGSIKTSVVYTVIVNWDGDLVEAEALAAENNPLLGTLLLDGFHIDIEATEGGEVIIEPL